MQKNNDSHCEKTGYHYFYIFPIKGHSTLSIRISVAWRSSPIKLPFKLTFMCSIRLPVIRSETDPAVPPDPFPAPTLFRNMQQRRSSEPIQLSSFVKRLGNCLFRQIHLKSAFYLVQGLFQGLGALQIGRQRLDQYLPDLRVLLHRPVQSFA